VLIGPIQPSNDSAVIGDRCTAEYFCHGMSDCPNPNGAATDPGGRYGTQTVTDMDQERLADVSRFRDAVLVTVKIDSRVRSPCEMAVRGGKDAQPDAVVLKTPVP
jgi:hypothetical protein